MSNKRRKARRNQTRQPAPKVASNGTGTGKTALETGNKSLRLLLERERKDHAEMLKAKNDALRIAQALNPTFELTRSFPTLPALLTQLVRAHEAAVAIRAAVMDSPINSHPTPSDTPTPLESAASTSWDRTRLKQIDEEVERWANWVKDQLGDRGPVEERAPQCGNPDCPAHAWAQPFDATECASCGLPFGKYYPKLSATRRQCWTRTCPHRGEIGECEHSLLGSSRSTPT